MWQHCVKIQGLPLRLAAWNTDFYKTDEISEHSPVYQLDPYFLLGWIPINGAKILKYQGIWVLWRLGEHQPLDFHSIEDNQMFPYGEWNGGVTVY